MLANNQSRVEFCKNIQNKTCTMFLANVYPNGRRAFEDGSKSSSKTGVSVTADGCYGLSLGRDGGRSRR